MYIYYEKIYTIYYGSKLVVYYNKNKHTHKTTYNYYYVCVHASKTFFFDGTFSTQFTVVQELVNYLCLLWPNIQSEVLLGTSLNLNNSAHIRNSQCGSYSSSYSFQQPMRQLFLIVLFSTANEDCSLFNEATLQQQ